MMYLKQSTASQSVLIGPFVDDTDGTTPETGLTIANTDIRLSANGGNLAAKNSGGGTHDEAGWYAITLDATDTATVGRLQLHCKMTGALMVHNDFHVLEEAVYDDLFAASAGGYLKPTTAGRTLDVASTGEAGLDFGNVTGTLSGGQLAAGVFGAGAITAAAVATGAIDADALAADAVAEIADGVWDEVLTGATHNVVSSAGRRLRSLQDNGVYALAAVWVDEVNGTSTGTTDFEDATVTNRATDFDNAQTVAASVGLNRIYVANGNSITLTATINNFQIGIPSGNWSLALGGQDIGGSDVYDAFISGIATGTIPHFHNCRVATAGVTVPPCVMYSTGWAGTVTAGSAGDFDFIDCFSEIPGSSAPTLDLGAAVGASNVSFRRWSGGLTLNNVATGDVVSVDVVSGGTITVNGTGGTVVVRGLCNVVDGSSGSVSITQTSVVNMTKINAEADTAISDASLATAAALATAQTDLDTLTGADGATLATSQPNYAPATAAALADLNDVSVADILTTQMAESYNADGAAPTLSQALHLLIAYLTERSVSGTTVTAKKLDGSTTAATFTLDSDTAPTSVTRAT